MIMYSISCDSMFMDKKNQVYVTYNDGILFDAGEKEQLKYRRKVMNPEILKRAVLTEFAKLVDNVVLRQPNLGWTTQEMKPQIGRAHV